jgi:hypothetical protein
MGRQDSAALVSPEPATDHPPYQFPEQQRQSGPESSGYDSEANQADYYALLRTCQIKPDYGRPETPVEVTICISSRLPRCIGRRGAIVKWISQDPNVETKDTTFDPSVSLPPNPYTVYVNTPVWPKEETVTVKVIDAEDNITEFGITQFRFIARNKPVHSLQVPCSASGSGDLDSMIDLFKSLTLQLERQKSLQEGQTASQGSREMVESEAFCAQYSSDSTILFQRLVAVRSSLEMSHRLEWDGSQLQHVLTSLDSLLSETTAGVHKQLERDVLSQKTTKKKNKQRRNTSTMKYMESSKMALSSSDSESMEHQKMQSFRRKLPRKIQDESDKDAGPANASHSSQDDDEGSSKDDESPTNTSYTENCGGTSLSEASLSEWQDDEAHKRKQQGKHIIL